MFASSSKHAVCVPKRATLSQWTAKSVSSIWQTSYPPVVPGATRNVATQAQALPRNSHSSRNSPGPKGQMWEFRRDDAFRLRRGAKTTEYNMALREAMSHKHIDRVVDLVRKMKRTNIRPDLDTYNTLLNALSLDYLDSECWAVFRDMRAVGIRPDTNTFNHLLYAHRKSKSTQIFQVLDEMGKYGLQPNTRTFEFIIYFYLECDNFEMALVKLAEMNDMGFSPNMKMAQALIERAGQLGQVRLALDLADAYEETTVRRLDSDTWVNLLISCAEELYPDGVLRCWDKIVTDLKICIDEGLCQSVLHTAARHGLPVLASEAIRQLEVIGVKFEEYHFTPMLDAFVQNQQLKEAFCVLDLMRTANAGPTIDSAFSILQAIRHDPDSIDNAYAQLEEIRREGQKVDVIAVNILIKASGILNDLQRAVGIYKAMPSLDVKPDAETFEMLLKACRKAQHMELGERLFGELREADIKPTAECYEAFISLILTQRDYENAFFYLEEMKAAEFTPSYSVYEDIVRKCVSNGDDRYKLAMDELEQMGYRVSARLRNFINNGGQGLSDQVSEDEMLPYETRKRIYEMKLADEQAAA